MDRHWHQGYITDTGLVLDGPSDTLAIMNACGVPGDLSGLNVLDIGALNGAATCEAIKRNAKSVVALDALPPKATGFDEVTRGLGRITFLNQSVYKQDATLEAAQFDVVFFFGVLYHLRYPLLALDRIRQWIAPSGHLYVESHTVGGDEHAARFYSADQLNGDPSNWFGPTVSCACDWLSSAGFDVKYQGHWIGDRACFECKALGVRPPFNETSNFEAVLDV